MKRIRMNVSVRNAAIQAPIIQKKKKRDKVLSATNVEQKSPHAPQPVQFADAQYLPLKSGIAMNVVLR